ncbi:MAG TPA: hypothetical protein VJK54_07530 [Chthoniobacterales bacterium]|nr:hypothetical protein [Chthoniobacterales bacterium]
MFIEKIVKELEQEGFFFRTLFIERLKKQFLTEVTDYHLCLIEKADIDTLMRWSFNIRKAKNIDEVFVCDDPLASKNTQADGTFNHQDIVEQLSLIRDEIGENLLKSYAPTNTERGVINLTVEDYKELNDSFFRNNKISSLFKIPNLSTVYLEAPSTETIPSSKDGYNNFKTLSFEDIKDMIGSLE